MTDLAQPSNTPRRVIPIRNVAAAPAGRQHLRSLTQIGFFLLFALAPVFDLFRFDLTSGHAWLLTFPWRLGIDDFSATPGGGTATGLGILVRLFLPLLLGGGAFIYAAWRWGRLYCGWLCPHFSAVETINQLMRRASGRQSVWDRQPIPPRRADGSPLPQHPLWWIPTVLFAVAFASLWAVVLLTYLLPPAEVYGNLLQLSPTRNQAIFLSAATAVLSIEFLFARHLFCRFGCAVGVFQSLAWMANRDAMVVGFRRERAADCAACYAAGGPEHAACEGVCPMRLRPRTQKVKMFTCTQCTQCIAACATVQAAQGRSGLLRWVDKDEARRNEAQVSLTGERD
ncbi:MAG: 4Fe-4S binding protein [Rhodocyclaceae bacterium]|jgi:polyferredoxin|nr:4Fe-4S binding protein [Rhodocyclaceae bacterium]